VDSVKKRSSRLEKSKYDFSLFFYATMWHIGGFYGKN